MHVTSPGSMEDYFRNHKDALEKRLRTYDDLSRRGRAVQNLGLLLVLGGMAVMLYVIYAAINPALAIGLSSVVLICAFCLAFLGRHMILSKGIPAFPHLYLSSDETIFLKVYDAWTSLASYLQEGLLEPARHQCLRYMRETYDLLNEYWKMSDVKVVMEEIGDEVDKFRKAFESHLIYTLEHKPKKEQADAVFFVLTVFGQFLIEPTKSRLVWMNVTIDDFQKRGDLLFNEKSSSPYLMLQYLKRHYVHQHAAIIGLIFAVGFVPAIWGLYSGQITTDTAYILFGTIFGPLLTAYFTFVLMRHRF